jgi:hypothetical protein
MAYSVPKPHIGVAVKKKPISRSAFEALAPVLRNQIVKAIEDQKKDSFIPVAPEHTDVFDVPAVDSKTVAKLSPIVESQIGYKLRPKWIRKGGYGSAEEAADDMISKIFENCYPPGSADVVRIERKRKPKKLKKAA